MKVTLEWNGNPLKRRERLLNDMQDCIDEDCMELMSRYVPVARPYYDGAGKLRDSGEIAGRGHIVYTEPYAPHQYYDPLDHSDTGNPKATRLWFETMKANHAAKILTDAQSMIDGKGKKH